MLAAAAVQEIMTDFRQAQAMSNGCLLVTANLRFFNALKDTPWGRYCLWVENVPERYSEIHEAACSAGCSVGRVDGKPTCAAGTVDHFAERGMVIVEGV